MMRPVSCGMDIEYSALDASGLDRIAPLWQKLREHHATIAPAFAASLLAKPFEERKNELLVKTRGGHLRIYLATDGIIKQDVGYCIASLTEAGEAEIDSIYVEETYRERDIGENLLEVTINWLESFAPKRIVLQVMAGNEKVVRFYEQFGFRPRTHILERVRSDGSG